MPAVHYDLSFFYKVTAGRLELQSCQSHSRTDMKDIYIKKSYNPTRTRTMHAYTPLKHGL